MIEKYAVCTVTNGNFLIRSEWSDPTAAIKAFHTLAAALWNDTNLSEGYIAILDSQLDVFEGYKERIAHEVQTQQEETPETTE